jgi:ADP-ribosyl-[dinitrogen reductase] hydrolase
LPLVRKSIGHLKIAFVWGFYYLKNGYSYSDALKDILLRGGDTDTNAAIVGGLLGAAYGISEIDENQR